MIKKENNHQHGSNRVIRDGSWKFNSQYRRSALRSGYGPANRHLSIGFRPAMEIRFLEQGGVFHESRTSS
jgi:formylglycine-generating enzyme required for sulfatase activity